MWIAKKRVSTSSADPFSQYSFPLDIPGTFAAIRAVASWFCPKNNPAALAFSLYLVLFHFLTTDTCENTGRCDMPR